MQLDRNKWEGQVPKLWLEGIITGRPSSPSHSCLRLDNIDEIRGNKEVGGSVTGKETIACFKFIDDIAIIADEKEGIQSTLRNINKYTEKN